MELHDTTHHPASNVVASPYFADYDSAVWRYGIATVTEHNMREIVKLAAEMADEAKAYGVTKVAHRDVIAQRPTDVNIEGIRRFDQSMSSHRRLVMLYSLIDGCMKEARESMETVFGRVEDYALQMAVSDFTDTVVAGREHPPPALPGIGIGHNMLLTFDNNIDGFGSEIKLLAIPGWSHETGNGWVISSGTSGIRVERANLIDAISWPHVTFWQAHMPTIAFIFATVLEPTKGDSGPVTNQISFIGGCCVSFSKKDTVAAVHRYLASFARF